MNRLLRILAALCFVGCVGFLLIIIGVNTSSTIDVTAHTGHLLVFGLEASLGLGALLLTLANRHRNSSASLFAVKLFVSGVFLLWSVLDIIRLSI